MTDGKPNYPGNSNSSRASAKKEVKEEKKVTPVAEGVQRKKSLGKRIFENFAGDDLHSVANYVLFEVFLPAAKNMVSEAASQGVERLLFGDSRPSSRSSTRTNYTSYNRMSKPEPRDISRRDRASHNFDEVTLPTRGEAEEVLDQLIVLIDKYDEASVSDLYELVSITPNFTDDKWGWKDLRRSRVVRTRDGFVLDLPKPDPL